MNDQADRVEMGNERELLGTWCQRYYLTPKTQEIKV